MLTCKGSWIALLLLHIVAAPVISLAAEAVPDTLPTLEEILERYIEATGGREAIGKLTARVSTGRQIDDRPYRGPAEVTPLKIYSMVPNKWVFFLHRPEGTFREGFDGEIGWRQEVDGVIRDDKLGRSKLAWFVNPQGPLRLQEYFPEMEVRGTESIGERLAYAVETDRDTAHFSLYFDRETGLLVRIGYDWEITDYRQVDGVLIPHRLVIGRKAGSSSLVLEDVQHENQIDPSLFVMPAPGAPPTGR